MLVVIVQDSGIGMDKNECKNLFKPFFRTHNNHSRQLNPSSNGLGLYICKLICESLNGNIKVVSEIGTGSKFIFSMQVFPVC